MTSSSDGQRTMVLRGLAADMVRPARLSADLRTSPYAGRFSADPRLVDPTLEAVVADAEELARKTGFEVGLAEGRAAALREAAARQVEQDRARAEREAIELGQRQAQWAQALDTLREAAADLHDREAPVLETLESRIATMAVEIAEALIGRHLELAGSPALDAVRRALALAPRQATVTVRVHPDDAGTLPDVSSALPGGTVSVVPDPGVEPGGCVVEAGDRSIDAQLGPALLRLREVLAG